MFELIRQIRWQDFVDIGIITFLVYRSLQIVRGSRAMQMIIGLAVILVAYVSSRALGLLTLNWILDNFLGSIILVIIVIFQSDIRRALTQVGSAPLFGAAERTVQPREDIVEEIVQAAAALAARHVGGLIVLEREVGLNEYMEIGTPSRASFCRIRRSMTVRWSFKRGGLPRCAVCCRSAPIPTYGNHGAPGIVLRLV